MSTNIILLGFKNCGKTTIGKLLSAVTHKTFVDIDDFIRDIYMQKHYKNCAIPVIYQKVGPSGFRALEKEAVLSLRDRCNTVIATGGGSVMDADNVRALKSVGTLIYLQADKATIKDKMLKEPLPAFIDPAHPNQSFEAMYQSRKKVYEHIADVMIRVDGKTPQQIVEEIIYGQ